MESDQRYYARRAAEESSRASRAITAEARERHRELATLYATKAAQLMGGEMKRVAASG